MGMLRENSKLGYDHFPLFTLIVEPHLPFYFLINENYYTKFSYNFLTTYTSLKRFLVLYMSKQKGATDRLVICQSI